MPIYIEKVIERPSISIEKAAIAMEHSLLCKIIETSDFAPGCLTAAHPTIQQSIIQQLIIHSIQQPIIQSLFGIQGLFDPSSSAAAAVTARGVE